MTFTIDLDADSTNYYIWYTRTGGVVSTTAGQYFKELMRLDENGNLTILGDINSSGSTDVWVNETGDTMSGSLVVNSANITVNSGNIFANQELYLGNWIRWSDTDGLLWSNNWYLHPIDANYFRVRSGSATVSGLRFSTPRMTLFL